MPPALCTLPSPSATGLRRYGPASAFSLVELALLLGLAGVLTAVALHAASSLAHHRSRLQALADLSRLAAVLEREHARQGVWLVEADLAARAGVGLDPWGSAYRCWHFPSAAGGCFLLVSAGPDKSLTPPAPDGSYGESLPGNADNLLLLGP